MDRFSKTTEIDISELAAIEDDTPKKSKIGNIIALILSIIIAIFIWLYVMETNVLTEQINIDDIYVYSYSDVNIPIEKRPIKVSGMRRYLVDFDKDDFKIIKKESGSYEVILFGTNSDVYKITNTSYENNEISISVNKK